MSEIFKLIEPLTKANAQIIANHWHNPGGGSLYEIDDDHECDAGFISKEQRFKDYFQVLNEEGALTACLSIKPDNDGYAEIDLGMAPELTGHGYGLSLMQSIENYVKRDTAFGGILLSVTTSNQRALKVFKRAGFEVIMLGEARATNVTDEFFKLFKKIVR